MRERNVSRNADVSVCALCNSCGRRNEQSGIDMIDARWILSSGAPVTDYTNFHRSRESPLNLPKRHLSKNSACRHLGGGIKAREVHVHWDGSED